MYANIPYMDPMGYIRLKRKNPRNQFLNGPLNLSIYYNSRNLLRGPLVRYHVIFGGNKEETCKLRLSMCKMTYGFNLSAHVFNRSKEPKYADEGAKFPKN